MGKFTAHSQTCSTQSLILSFMNESIQDFTKIKKADNMEICKNQANDLKADIL